VEVIQALASLSEFVECRHFARPAKRARLSKANVVQQTTTTFGAPLGALTSKRGGALALRASSSVISGHLGSGIGNTVPSSFAAAGCALDLSMGFVHEW
jgi:hypothetical protein